MILGDILACFSVVEVVDVGRRAGTESVLEEEVEVAFSIGEDFEFEYATFLEIFPVLEFVVLNVEFVDALAGFGVTLHTAHY